MFLSLTSAVDKCGWLTLHPGHFIVGKETRYPLLGGLEGPSGRLRKILPLQVFDPWCVHLVTIRYTIHAILAQGISSKAGLKKIRWEVVDCIDLVHDKAQRSALVRTVKAIIGLKGKKVWNSLGSSATFNSK